MENPHYYLGGAFVDVVEKVHPHIQPPGTIIDEGDFKTICGKIYPHTKHNAVLVKRPFVEKMAVLYIHRQ